MKQNDKTKLMAITSLLCAIGIIIPLVAPKFVLEPASFTLASHVPVFIAMFISPTVAIFVALITGFGFFFAGFPIVVVLRALSHIIFAAIGGFLLKKNSDYLNTVKSRGVFSFLISMLHAICEVTVVTVFYFGNNMSSLYYEQGYLLSVMALVGVGTLLHSIIDFGIAFFVWKPLQHVTNVPVSVRITSEIKQ